MAKLVWDESVNKKFETGIEQVALFVMGSGGTYETGVPWNGFTGMSENPSGAEANELYANNKKYVELRSKEKFEATMTAYTFPAEFNACDGKAELVTGAQIGQQDRKSFALAYITLQGNEAEGTDYGKKLHLIYGAKAAPSAKDYQSEGESPEAADFSWDITTTPVDVEGKKPTAEIVIDSTIVAADKWTAIMDKVYGDATTGTSTMPTPAEVKALLATA